MTTTAREQPPWRQPIAPSLRSDLPPIKIYNSLTRSKTPFIPIKEEISWYICGPTVYELSHLGHARNYCTSDIIRRILKDYFKFKVKYVMNITDVDDKIILRGRQQHLFDDFVSKNAHSKPIETVGEALKQYVSKNLPLVSRDIALGNIEAEVKNVYKIVLSGGSLDNTPVGDREAKLKMHIRTAVSAAEALNPASQMTLSEFYTHTQDILLPYLDSLYGNGINADDHSIFTKITTKYEQAFMEDMRSLNCLDPDVITRVTEYGPQIVQFVQRIEENGFAYKTSDGSVYFDVKAFESANNKYPRLEPWSRNDKGRQAEGEGALVQTTSEKKGGSDFALWKASRPGEPSWSSPWGKGRPGWHIECSAMASEVIGQHIDIHSGGIDLAFPHHDNELAQSEAYWAEKHQHEQHQWVNYFLHMGHLSIAGSKMSKSLKNFTTIREALSRGDWNSRSLRIVFLLGNWRDGIEITDSYVKESTAWEDRLDNFFFKVHDLIDRKKTATSSSSSNSNEVLISSELKKAKQDTFDALCDSFNTRQVMLTISELIGTANTSDWTQSHSDIIAVAEWITEMVNIFGLNGKATGDSIGWTGSSIPDEAKQHVYALSDLRDELRKKARSSSGIDRQELKALSTTSDDKADSSGEQYRAIASKFAEDLNSITSEDSKVISKSVLELCDRLRDVDLWDKGIYLEDSVNASEPAIVRPVTKELIVAREGRDKQRLEKQKAKEDRERLAAEESARKAEQGKVSHLEMFKTNEYSAWDEDGLPTKDHEGKDVAKSRQKKLRKDWERQKRLHESWLTSNQ